MDSAWFCKRISIKRLRKDCVHISGLEVEGRHPRALMESALLHRHQVIGLERPSRQSGWKEAGLTGCAIIQHSCNLKEDFPRKVSRLKRRGGTVGSVVSDLPALAGSLLEM